MEKMKQFVNGVIDTKYEVSNGKIKQTQRNGIKKDFLDALSEALSGAGFETFRTNDGIILAIPNKRTEVFIAIDGVIKNLDYDLDFEIGEYELKLEKQAEREKERLEKSKKE